MWLEKMPDISIFLNLLRLILWSLMQSILRMVHVNLKINYLVTLLDGMSYRCLLNYLVWRRQWPPTPVLLPRKSHGRRSLVGCSSWGRQSRARLSDFTFTFHFHALEKEMATHSSVLAWRIPGSGSLVGCHLWGRTESDTTEVTQHQQQTIWSSMPFKDNISLLISNH